jgi:hypothetical protein
MVRYGIYTVKELERFAKGLTPKRNITILSECTKCDFVYDGKMCLNCHPWNTVRWRVTCQRDLPSSAIIICVQKDNSSSAYIESVWKRGISPTSLRNGSTGNMVKWWSNAKPFTEMQCHYLVSYVGKLWRGWVYAGQPTTVNNGFTVKNLYIYHLQYQPPNKKGT